MYTSIHQSRLIPSGISLVCNRTSNVACDNYELFVETLSGKSTLMIEINNQFTRNVENEYILSIYILT